MNWFHYILITLLAFVSMLVYFAVRSASANLDLVTDSYYEAELNFQEKINQKANVQMLSQEVDIEQKETNLVFHFPKEVKNITGNIFLYCPSNKKNDETIALNIDTNNEQILNIHQRSGLYQVQINWQSGSEKYYTERKIFF